MNIAAEILPTHERIFIRNCGSNLTTAMVPMQIRKGIIIHVANQRLNRNINAVLAIARDA